MCVMRVVAMVGTRVGLGFVCDACDSGQALHQSVVLLLELVRIRGLDSECVAAAARVRRAPCTSHARGARTTHTALVQAKERASPGDVRGEVLHAPGRCAEDSLVNVDAERIDAHIVWRRVNNLKDIF